MSLSATKRAVFARFAGLILYKAFPFLRLALLSLFLLTARPVLAQMPSGYWTVQDANGNPVTQNADGSYTLTGTMSGSATDGFPGLLALAKAQPPGSQAQYVNAFSPNELGGSFSFLYNGTSGSPSMGNGL